MCLTGVVLPRTEMPGNTPCCDEGAYVRVVGRVMFRGEPSWHPLALSPPTHNLVVVGSSPTRPTMFSLTKWKENAHLSCCSRLVCYLFCYLSVTNKHHAACKRS
jgi:hypothetical protein